jgi:hypothetical protein
MVTKARFYSFCFLLFAVVVSCVVLLWQLSPQGNVWENVVNPLLSKHEARKHANDDTPIQPNVTNADLSLTYLRKNFLMSPEDLQKMFSPRFSDLLQQKTDDGINQKTDGKEELQSIEIGDKEYIYRPIAMRHPEASMLNVTFFSIQPQSSATKPVLEDFVNLKKVASYDKRRYRLFYSQPYIPSNDVKSWMLQQSNNVTASVTVVVQMPSDLQELFGWSLTLKHDDGDAFMKYLTSLKASTNRSNASPQPSTDKVTQKDASEYEGWQEASVNSLDGKVRVLFPNQFTEDSNSASESNAQSVDDKGRRVVRYNMIEGDIKYHFSLWTREGNALSDLTEEQRTWWFDEALKTLYGSIPADDTQTLSLGTYPGIATTHTLTNKGRVAMTQVFLTDKLIIVTQASTPITPDDATKDRALSFLRTLSLN